MAKNYVQVGNTLTLTAPVGGVVSGMVYLMGSLPVVAEFSAAQDEPFEGSTCGVYSLPKVPADTPAQGAKAYLLVDGTAVTTVVGSNKLIGVFTNSYANGTTVADVRLNGVSV